MNRPRLLDEPARVRAATEFDVNLLVTAGAGTGKTGLLVERYLNEALSGETGLASIVAVTFTEKAAAEMRARVIQGLETMAGVESGAEASEEAARSYRWLTGERGIPAPVLAQRAREGLDQIDTASIGTIHGYCSELLRRHPIAADVPPEFTIDEGYTQDLLFEETWTDFLAEELGAHPRRPELWQRTLTRFLESEIEQMAASLVRSPAAAELLVREGYRALDVLDLFGGTARELLEELTGIGERIVRPQGKKPSYPEFLDQTVGLLARFLEDGPEGLQAATLEPFTDYWTKTYIPVPKPLSGDPDEKEAMQKTAENASKLLRKLYQVHEGAFPDLMEVLRPFAARFRERVRRKGCLTFSDLLLMARNLLAEHGEIRQGEAARIRSLLVDEFQDTDPLQYEIVFLLATTDEGPIRNAYEATLAPGRLFIVGDAKQSIYRFRGADMTAYRLAEDRILKNGRRESLVTNFRSRPGIIDAVNTLFTSWIGPSTGENAGVEPDYEAIESFRPVEEEFPVELWTVATAPDADATTRRRQEARHIAAEIRNQGWKLGRVALLFRALSDAPIYTRALREAGIPFVVDGGRAFAERPEIVEAFALLGAIANPADPVALLGVLRSTLGGIPDARLAEFARAGGRFRWTAPPEKQPEGYDDILRVFDLLRRMDRTRSRMPLDRWIQQTLTESAFTLLTSTYFEGAQRLANVKKFAELAGALVRDRGFTLEQAVEALDRTLTGPRAEGDSPLADEDLDAVRILTIHKAKGLEYPVVFVPDISRANPGPSSEDRIDLVWTDHGPRLGVDMPERTKMRNAAALFAKERERRHSDAEIKRLFYVATTRAREKLIIVNSSPFRRNLWLTGLKTYWGYEEALTAAGPVLAGQRVQHRLLEDAATVAAERGESTAPDAALAAFITAKTAAAASRPPRHRTPSGDHREEVVETGTAPRDRTLARAAGTAVHRLLETWDFQDPRPLREGVPAVAEATAREFGIDPKAVAGDVRRILEGFLASDLPRELAGAEILGREVPILLRDRDAVTVHGYADLVYRREGRVHVADFKSDETTDAAHAEIYRSQLTDYRDAIHRGLRLDTLPVAEVIFLRNGTRVELAPEESAR